MGFLLLLLIPIAALVGIFVGTPTRLTAVSAALANLALALFLSFAWQSQGQELDGFSVLVLEKPAIHLALGFYDGMSVVMVLLSAIVTVAALMSGNCPTGKEKMWYSSALLISTGALGAFLSTDLFFFYAFHELALIPTFIMIGLLGRGDRKEAAWKITIYLAFGSIILLAGLLWLVGASGAETLLFDDLLAGSIDPATQRSIAAFLLVGFGTLISLFPFHSWAAPAYASAPAPVAMLHAGVLKKFGLYGLIRLYPLVPEGLQSWLTVLVVLLLGNILWVGFVTINQKRLDSMLGNSSVMHMGYIFLAIAALVATGNDGSNTIAIPAAVVLMFAHGISIALLLGLADRIENAAGTLELSQLGGLAKNAPVLAFLFGLAGMASIGLPGLANFAGEVMVFLSGFQNWDPSQSFGVVQVGTVLALWGLVISAVYMLRAYRKTFQGPVATATENSTDLSKQDQLPAIILAVTLLIVGLYPNSLLRFLSPPETPAATTMVTDAN